MVSQIADGSIGVISLFDVPLITFVNIVVEWIFKGNCVGFIGALGLNSEGSDDGFVCSPRVRDQSCSVEKSRPDNVSLEILL